MNAALDLLQARAGEQLATLERVHRELAEVSAERTVDTGRVRVVVDAAGALSCLALTHGAGSGDATRLAALIVEAAAEAAREVYERHSEITADFLAEFGPESTTEDAIEDAGGEQ
ncbi:MAG: YbaB/EbfC family nucleoid-associated protein [Gordonia sp. (in: high G+C Gram-positive bacteria)]